MRGRPPKSAAQHAADGTFRKDRHGSRAELQISPAKPTVPRGLPPEARALWRRVVAELPAEALSRLDGEALRAYCVAWSIYRRIEPLMVDNPTDKDIRIAWTAVLSTLDKLGQQFGWTPRSRSSLRLPAEADETADPFAEFIRRRLERS